MSGLFSSLASDYLNTITTWDPSSTISESILDHPTSIVLLGAAGIAVATAGLFHCSRRFSAPLSSELEDRSEQIAKNILALPGRDRANHTYVGEMKDGKPHGEGTMSFQNGDVYRGGWRRGKFHGYGVYTFKGGFQKGNFYKGEFTSFYNHREGSSLSMSQSDSLPEKNVVQFPNGDSYEGRIKEGQPHGQGIMKFANGDVYEGQWKQGLFHGKGILRLVIGEIHEGEFNFGELKGKRIVRYPDGSVYEGEWKQGKQHGNGLIRMPNGKVYEGRFNNGELQDRRVIRFSNGDCYEGVWKHHQPHGWGIFHFANGASHEGLFSNGEILGKITIRYADGDVYKGEWKDGIRHGKGRLIRSRGGSWKGHWNRNKKDGFGVDITSNGTRISGMWKHNRPHGILTHYWQEDSRRFTQEISFDDGRMIDLDRSHIGDPLFLSLLFGLKGSFTPGPYALLILSDYLAHYFADDASILNEVIAPLVNAKQFSPKVTSDEQLVGLIEDVKQGHSILIPLHTLGHSVGLNICLNKSKDLVRFEIFNSGEGLCRFHEYDSEKDKYKTMKVIEIPCEHFTIDQLRQLLKEYENVRQAYLEILDILGAKKVQSEGPWQSEQENGTCGIEWIFAYLKNKLPLGRYLKLRKDLFNDCLHAYLAKPKKHIDVLTLDRVVYKMKKMGLDPEKLNHPKSQRELQDAEVNSLIQSESQSPFPTSA